MTKKEKTKPLLDYFVVRLSACQDLFSQWRYQIEILPYTLEL